MDQGEAHGQDPLQELVVFMNDFYKQPVALIRRHPGQQKTEKNPVAGPRMRAESIKR
jgi:hypothetical protein